MSSESSSFVIAPRRSRVLLFAAAGLWLLLLASLYSAHLSWLLKTGIFAFALWITFFDLQRSRNPHAIAWRGGEWRLVHEKGDIPLELQPRALLTNRFSVVRFREPGAGSRHAVVLLPDSCSVEAHRKLRYRVMRELESSSAERITPGQWIRHRLLKLRGPGRSS